MDNKNYLFNLTPLRGIAALLTVLFHLNLGSNALLNPEWSHGFDKLYLMVDFFFILSGFIMVHVYSGWFQNGFDRQAFKKFTIARFARVYPLHFFTLLYLILLQGVYWMMGGTYNDPFSANSFTLQSIPTNLLLIHSMNIHGWFTWNNASWSISTEWWAYMVFPFLVYWFANLKSVGRWLIILACIGGYLSIIYFFQDLVTYPEGMEFIKPFAAKTLNVAYQYGYLRCIFGFILGMMCYRLYQEKWGSKVLGNGYTLAVLGIILFLFMHLFLLDLYIVLIFPFILLSASYGSKGMNSLFESKPMQKLGDWSFAIYLVHQPIIYTRETIHALMVKNPPIGEAPAPSYLVNWLVAFGFITFTLLVSYLVYEKIEVPWRNKIKIKYSN